MGRRAFCLVVVVAMALALSTALATSAWGAPAESFTSITAGEEDTCALTSGGEVMCWGRNQFGQLATGSVDDLSHPVPSVVTGLESGVRSVSAGWRHVCAVTADGGVKCWGSNKYGQLGDGSTTDTSTPTDVMGLTSGVGALASGELHMCSLSSAGGVKCWGSNLEGGLGNDSTVDSSMPVDVVGLASGATAIVVGQTHSCALISDGTVKCWGGNGIGQLGHAPTTRDTMSLRPVDVPGLANVAAIAAGDDHMCALTSGRWRQVLGQ